MSRLTALFSGEGMNGPAVAIRLSQTFFEKT